MSERDIESIMSAIADLRFEVTELKGRTQRLEGSWMDLQGRLDRIYGTLLGLAATVVIGLIGILVAILTHHAG